jgi:hypothetical protein
MEDRSGEAEEHYKRALAECPHDAFAVDSVAQQLEMFQSLGYRTAPCRAALAILNEHRHRDDGMPG